MITKLSQDKWTEILIDIYNHEETIGNAISQRTKYTYAFVTQILEVFDKTKIINRRTDGRMRIITLTPKGVELAKHIIEVKRLIK